jgi:hypothetical protein
LRISSTGAVSNGIEFQPLGVGELGPHTLYQTRAKFTSDGNQGAPGSFGLELINASASI